MSTDPTTLEDFQRLSDMFHDGRPTGTVTRRVRLEVKTPHNALVLHVFEDDVPFDHWLVTQYPRLKMVLSSACRLSAMAPLSNKGLTPLHYGVLVGMSPEELTALRGKWPWSLMAPGPSVPTALQLAIALGRPELTNCLVRWTPAVLAPQPRCELETLYPASGMDVYALTLSRLRKEEDSALKKAYRDAATEIEGAQCADLREPLDSAHSRRHNLLSILPYVLLFVLLGCAHPFFFRFPVDEAILDAKEAAIEDCNGDGFVCARALNSSVIEPMTLCGNGSEQSPCLFQTYVTTTALLATAAPFGSGRRYRAPPRSLPRRLADWGYWTWESNADWKCRFDTVATQRPPPNSPVTYTHRVVCTGPVEFTFALFFLTVICTVGVFTSLLRDLRTWHRGHLCLVWRDRLRLWMGVASDAILCVAGGFLAFSLRPQGAFPHVGSVELGRLATAAAVLCVPKCSYLLPSGNNTSAAHTVWMFAGVACGMCGIAFIGTREPIALLFCLFLAVVYALVLCEDRRPDPAVWHEHRLAYLEEALSGRPAVSVLDFNLVRWGCYCTVALCFAALAQDLRLTSGSHQRSPYCEWGSGCVIRRPDMALYSQRKIQFVKPSVEQAPP